MYDINGKRIIYIEPIAHAQLQKLTGDHGIAIATPDYLFLSEHHKPNIDKPEPFQPISPDTLNAERQKAYRAGVLNALNVQEQYIQNLFNIRQYRNYGDIKIESWPEGIVLWIGGEIVYKSWRK